MKKSFIIALSSVYLLLSVGITKSTHLCMGREMNTAYFSQDVEGCGGSENRQMPCCEDVNEILEIEDEHKNYSSDIFVSTDFEIISLPELLDLDELRNEDSKRIIKIPDPPGKPSIPLYLSFSSLTYYG